MPARCWLHPRRQKGFWTDVVLLEGEHDLVVTDIKIPDADGMAVLDAARRLVPSTPVILITAFASVEAAVEAMRRGLKLAAARGVTAVHDKDGWLGALRLWQKLEAAGSLTLRVWQSLPGEQVGELQSLGIRSGFGSSLLRIGYLQMFMDGTLGSQTALMLDGSGVRITTAEALAEIVRAGAAAGLPVAVHAIGDRANRDALDAFEATRGVWQPPGLRPRRHGVVDADANGRRGSVQGGRSGQLRQLVGVFALGWPEDKLGDRCLAWCH